MISPTPGWANPGPPPLAGQPGMLHEAQEPFGGPDDAAPWPALAGDRTRQLTERAARDHAFAAAIRQAYDRTCAVTGLQLLNGGGRAEVEAAHIRPVAQDGPDTVRNGIALCGTVHWMFDRGLISLSDDLRLLHSRSAPVPKALAALFPDDGRVRTPAAAHLRPHPTYLGFHRRHVFKG